MFVQSTTFITDFYKFQSSYSPTSSHGEPERKKKKNVEPRNRKQSTAYSELPFFEIQSSATPTSSRGEPEKKEKKNPVEPCNREQSTAYSELPFEIGSRLYHFNGCAKYHNFFFH